jgi:hypothetical protein
MYFARGKFKPSGKGPTVLPGGSIFNPLQEKGTYCQSFVVQARQVQPEAAIETL